MTIKRVLLTLLVLLIGGTAVAALHFRAIAAAQRKQITVRTETYGWGSYSDATYYIYESGGEAICTKLEICNKFDECHTTYKKGTYTDEQNVNQDPYKKTDAVIIPQGKLRKHVCLTKFKLL